MGADTLWISTALCSHPTSVYLALEFIESVRPTCLPLTKGCLVDQRRRNPHLPPSPYVSHFCRRNWKGASTGHMFLTWRKNLLSLSRKLRMRTKPRPRLQLDKEAVSYKDYSMVSEIPDHPYNPVPSYLQFQGWKMPLLRRIIRSAHKGSVSSTCLHLENRCIRYHKAKYTVVLRK